MLPAATVLPTRRSTRPSKPAVFFNPSSVRVPPSPSKGARKSRATPSLKQIASGRSSEESAVETSSGSESESFVSARETQSSEEALISLATSPMVKKAPGKRVAAEVVDVDEDGDGGDAVGPRKRGRRAAAPPSQSPAGPSKSNAPKAPLSAGKKKQVASESSPPKKVVTGPRGRPPGLREPPDDVRSILQPSPPPGEATTVVDLKAFKCSIDLKWMSKVDFVVGVKRSLEREVSFAHKPAREIVRIYSGVDEATPVVHGFTPELVRHPGFFSSHPGTWLIDHGKGVEDLVRKYNDLIIDRRAFRYKCPELLPLEPLPEDPLNPAYFSKDDPRPLPPTKTATPYHAFDPSLSLTMQQHEAAYQAHLELERLHDEAQKKELDEARAKYRSENVAWMERNKSHQEKVISEHQRQSAVIEDYNGCRAAALSHYDVSLNTLGIFISLVARAEYEYLAGGSDPSVPPPIFDAPSSGSQPPKIPKKKGLSSSAGNDSADRRWMELISPSPSADAVARFSKAFPECELVALISEMYSLRASGRCIGGKRMEQFVADWKMIQGAISQYDSEKWHDENPLFNRWAPMPFSDVPVNRGYEYDKRAARFLQGFAEDYVLVKTLENRVGFDRGLLCFECFFGGIPCLRVAHGTSKLQAKCNFCRSNTSLCVPVPFPASFEITDRGKAQLNDKWMAFQLNEWIEDSAGNSGGALPEMLLSVIIGWIQRNSGDDAARAARTRVYSSSVAPLPSSGENNAVASSSSSGALPSLPETGLIRFPSEVGDKKISRDSDGDINMHGVDEQVGKEVEPAGGGVEFPPADFQGSGGARSSLPARVSPPPRTGSSSSLAGALGKTLSRPPEKTSHSAPGSTSAPVSTRSPSIPSAYLPAPRPQSFTDRQRSFTSGSISVAPTYPGGSLGVLLSNLSGSSSGSTHGNASSTLPWRRVGGEEETDAFGTSTQPSSSSGNFGFGIQSSSTRGRSPRGARSASRETRRAKLVRKKRVRKKRVRKKRGRKKRGRKKRGRKKRGRKKRGRKKRGRKKRGRKKRGRKKRGRKKRGRKKRGRKMRGRKMRGRKMRGPQDARTARCADRKMRGPQDARTAQDARHRNFFLLRSSPFPFLLIPGLRICRSSSGCSVISRKIRPFIFIFRGAFVI
ncbi:hypothetical protein DFH06DRAFT_1318229 [Mycena polygramma]|nr:hypothetical protein DFH06DRAFT_1318229 [Mycena polygramma]